MPLDPSIFAPYVQRPVNPLDVQNALMHRDALQQQNQLAAMQMQAQQRSMAEEQVVAEAVRSSAGDPAKIRQALILGGHLKPLNEYDKAQAELEAKKAAAEASRASTGHSAAQTAGLALDQYRDLLTTAKTRQDVEMWTDGLFKDPRTAPVAASFGTPEEWKARIPAGGPELQDYINKNALKMKEYVHDLTQKRGQDLQRSTSLETNALTNATSRANTAAHVAATMRGQNMTDARAGQALQAPRYEMTDAGLVMLPGKVAPGQVPTPIPLKTAEGETVGRPLKPIPASVNTAIIANSQAGKQLDRALTLIEGKDIGDPAKGGMQGDASATGWKGYLPQPLLNRTDPKGVAARAEIADVGSLKIHDRSGAAVTISEAPRLVPFIPLATDDQATVTKKLRRLRLEIDNESKAMAETYSQDQGYRPSPVLKPGKVLRFDAQGNPVP